MSNGWLVNNLKLKSPTPSYDANLTLSFIIRLKFMTQQHPNDMQKADYDDNYDGITFEVIEAEEKGGTKQLSRGVYLVPNLITAASMLAAFFSITSGANGQFMQASLAIFISAILDGMDGRAARLLNAQSPFGEQFDSLADCIAFGLAPALLMYFFALQHLGRFGLTCSFLFTACAAFRLARFNVQIGVVDKKYFIGLASPLAAILIASGVMVAHDYHIFDKQILAIVCAVWTVVCGLLMVSNIKYYSFKVFDKQKVPFFALIIGVLVMGIALYDIPVGILAIGIIYALSGFFTTFLTKRTL